MLEITLGTNQDMAFSVNGQIIVLKTGDELDRGSSNQSWWINL